MRESTRAYLDLVGQLLLEIDVAISRRLLRSVQPHEVTLTDELLARLDARSRRRETPEREAAFLADETALRERFGRTGPAPIPRPLDFSVRSFDHSRGFEAKVSKVDVGLIVEFGEPGSRKHARYMYLLQAKKLRLRMGKDGQLGFDAGSKFSSLKAEQHLAMQHLEQRFGIGAFRYMYYMPPREFVDGAEAPAAEASALAAQFANAGIWIGRVGDRMSTDPATIYRGHLTDTAPLMAVILGHVAQALEGREAASGLVGRAHVEATKPDGDDLTTALASGDPGMVEGVLDRLGLDPVAYAPVASATLTLRLPELPRPAPVQVLGRSRGFGASQHRAG